MGKSHSKQPDNIPIQSYIDHVTEKSRKLWKNENLIENQDNIPSSAAKKLIKYPIRTKKGFLDFFNLCSYKDQKQNENFDPNEVIFFNSFFYFF